MWFTDLTAMIMGHLQWHWNYLSHCNRKESRSQMVSLGGPWFWGIQNVCKDRMLWDCFIKCNGKGCGLDRPCHFCCGFALTEESAWRVFHNISICLVVSWMPCLEDFLCSGMLRKHKCPFWTDVSWRWRDLSCHFWFFGLSAYTSCRLTRWSPRLLWYRG